ncbi:MAG: hypothetical protein AAFP19_09115 [Bacteroidota bacterium]
MQTLRELVQIITKNKVQQIEVIGNSDHTDSMVHQFYEALVEGRFTSDEEAADFFYQDRVNDRNYENLKYKLRRRLLNTLFFIDIKQPSYNDQQRAYYNCYKDWAAAKILLGKEARNAGIKLCQSILQKAIRYEFTELIIPISQMLRLHYGTRVGNYKKFVHYDELFKKYEKVWQAEQLSEELYTRLIIEYVNNKASKTDTFNKAAEYFATLQGHMEQSDSYKLHLYGHYINIIGSMSTNDYARTISVCEAAIQFFESKAYQSKKPIQIFQHQLLVCYTQLRQYEKGKAVAEKSLLHLDNGSFNWFKHQELVLLLSMHTEQYQQAYTILAEVKKHKRFRFIATNIIELWKIYEAYMHYLIAIEEVSANDSAITARKFKLGKFLNEVPTFSKDKRGMNIPILIIQSLFLIVHKKYNQAIDRIEAVEKYCNRYLKKNHNYRSNCFIKMLLQIPISGFHKAAVIRRADKYLKMLESTPLEVANQPHEIEIIPYEQLWAFALNSLEYKRYQKRSNRS